MLAVYGPRGHATDRTGGAMDTTILATTAAFLRVAAGAMVGRGVIGR
jgi:hypothetical protein